MFFRMFQRCSDPGGCSLRGLGASRRPVLRCRTPYLSSLANAGDLAPARCRLQPAAEPGW